MNLITYEDKVAFNENPQIADINKVTASDMNQIKNAINNLFPVGFIISVDNAEFNPNTSWGGTWERLKGRFIIGVDEDDTDFKQSGLTGGEKTHTLTVNEIPAHFHNQRIHSNNTGSATEQASGHYFNDNTVQWSGSNRTMHILSGGYTGMTGDGQPHNNMPPYYTAYRWIKTAM